MGKQTVFKKGGKTAKKIALKYTINCKLPIEDNVIVLFTTRFRHGDLGDGVFVFVFANVRPGGVCRRRQPLLVAGRMVGYGGPRTAAAAARDCGNFRRRGHGLGSGSIFPGDVAIDNDVILEPGMLFVVSAIISLTLGVNMLIDNLPEHLRPQREP